MFWMADSDLSEIHFVWLVVRIASLLVLLVPVASLLVLLVPVPLVNLSSGKAQSICQVLGMFAGPVRVGFILSL